MTYEAIAAQVGLSPAGVFNICQRYAERGAAGLKTCRPGLGPGHRGYRAGNRLLECAPSSLSLRTAAGRHRLRRQPGVALLPKAAKLGKSSIEQRCGRYTSLALGARRRRRCHRRTRRGVGAVSVAPLDHDRRRGGGGCARSCRNIRRERR
ncbi:hypothetical protein, partial [Siccirubricoccus deserti]|uniref:hypothetical protein n=1 Tax=Siccirubricoccus deserti TaxID=2013562 RepID=UPI0036F221F7